MTERAVGPLVIIVVAPGVQEGLGVREVHAGVDVQALIAVEADPRLLARASADLHAFQSVKAMHPLLIVRPAFALEQDSNLRPPAQKAGALSS